MPKGFRNAPSGNASADKQTDERRMKNKESVRRHRERQKQEDAEMHRLYMENEKRIQRLEKMAKNLSKELKR